MNYKELRYKYRQFCKKYRLKGASDREIKATLQDLFGVVEGREFQGDYKWEGISFKDNLNKVLIPKEEEVIKVTKINIEKDKKADGTEMQNKL